MPGWFKVIIKILAIPVILICVMLIACKVTEYKYAEFQNIISYKGNYEVYQAYYDEYCVNGVAVYPSVNVGDGRVGSYRVFAGMHSQTEDCKASVNDVIARLYMTNGECKQLKVDLEDKNVYELKQTSIGYCNYADLCAFSIDYANTKLKDIERLELSVDLTVERDGVTERETVSNTYMPVIEKSDSVTDWLLSV